MNSSLIKISRNLVRFVNSCSKFKPLSIELCSGQRNYSLQIDSYSTKFTPQFEFHFSDDFNRSINVEDNSYWRRKMRTIHNLLDVNKDGIISYDDFVLLANRFVRLGNLQYDQQVEFYEIIEVKEGKINYRTPFDNLYHEKYIKTIYNFFSLE